MSSFSDHSNLIGNFLSEEEIKNSCLINVVSNVLDFLGLEKEYSVNYDGDFIPLCANDINVSIVDPEEVSQITTIGNESKGTFPTIKVEYQNNKRDTSNQEE